MRRRIVREGLREPTWRLKGEKNAPLNRKSEELLWSGDDRDTLSSTVIETQTRRI